MYTGNGNGLGCGGCGLSGMGLAPPSPVPVQEQSTLERVIGVAEDIYTQWRRDAAGPVYTPPYASDYPTYYPTAPAAVQTDLGSMLPWVLGAILLYVVIQK